MIKPSPFEAAHLTVFERGWLSSNNTLLQGNGSGAVLIDTGHTAHAAQTVALVGQALLGEPLVSVVNTHLHSDHCGGNAALRRAFGCSLVVPPGQWSAVQAWDEEALSYAPTRQRCERFVADAVLRPGQVLDVGGQRWDAFSAPGHDPHSLILFNARHGILLSADALWERGFGVVFPELDGESAFDDVERVLDLIAKLDARWVVPGHGAAFDDVGGALKRARERLAAFRARPERHAHHAIKALVKFHLLEVGAAPWSSLMSWFESVPLYLRVWQRIGQPGGSLTAFGSIIAHELVAAGVLVVRDGVVHND